jgi:hypothetical protein
MRSWHFLSYLKTPYVLWSLKVWYRIHELLLVAMLTKMNPLHITNLINPSSYVGVGDLSSATGITLPPLLLKTSSDTFLHMTSQCDRIVKLKQQFPIHKKSALPPHCFRNHFNIILPSMSVWPFFCFIHKLLCYEWTCYTLVNTEMDLCTNRRDCKQWWSVNIMHQQSTKFQRTKFGVMEELEWNICTILIFTAGKAHVILWVFA